MSNLYVPGEIARITLAVANFSGAVADPGAIALKVKNPAGTVSTVTYAGGGVIKTAVGRYYADVLLDQAGAWAFRWELAAPNAGACEGAITVSASLVI